MTVQVVQPEYEQMEVPGMGIELQVPKTAHLPTEQECAVYQALFDTVKQEGNWKETTKPFTTKDFTMAKLMAKAITFFVGGAEVEDNEDGVITVTSKGYYHYIGA